MKGIKPKKVGGNSTQFKMAKTAGMGKSMGKGSRKKSRKKY